VNSAHGHINLLAFNFLRELKFSCDFSHANIIFGSSDKNVDPQLQFFKASVKDSR